MRILKALKKPSRHKITILTAALLLTTGFSIWLYATTVIQGHTQLLNSSKLTQEETWNYQGSLQWWQTTYTTTIIPLTTIMITVGFINLLGPTVWTKIQLKYALKAFTDSLERASTEKFEIE